MGAGASVHRTHQTDHYPLSVSWTPITFSHPNFPCGPKTHGVFKDLSRVACGYLVCARWRCCSPSHALPSHRELYPLARSGVHDSTSTCTSGHVGISIHSMPFPPLSSYATEPASCNVFSESFRAPRPEMCVPRVGVVPAGGGPGRASAATRGKPWPPQIGRGE